MVEDTDERTYSGSRPQVCAWATDVDNRHRWHLLPHIAGLFSMSAATLKRRKQPHYIWEDERGVVALGERGANTQAIQLLHGPASMAFRRKCGLLLVNALNRSLSKSRN